MAAKSPEKPKPRRISVVLKGSADDSGNVRLSDMIHALASVRASLFAAGGWTLGRDFRVVDLHHSNATLVLEEVQPKDADRSAVAQLVGDFSALKRARPTAVSPVPDPLLLEQYVRLARPKGRVAELEIRSGRSVTRINAELHHRLKTLLGEDDVELGCYSGFLRKIDLEKRNKEFFIIPAHGPARIRCQFPDSLRQRSVEAVDKFVTVWGSVRTKAWAKFPHAIQPVSDIEIHPDNAKLPTFASLAGIADGQVDDAVQWVRSHRGDA